MKMKASTFAISALALGLAAVALPAAAADERPRIVVTGEGEAATAPDLAMLSLTVMREAQSAREALTANSDAMTAVIAAMKDFGIAERDLQTSNIRIDPRYSHAPKPDGTQQATLTGYTVSNSLTVRVRDISKAGEVLDKAVSLGVNQGGGISFGNEDPAAVVKEARRKAVADAFEKAGTLAEAAGGKLGRVMEIIDQNIGVAPQMLRAKAFDAASAVPIQSGENAYSVQVSVTFELK